MELAEHLGGMTVTEMLARMSDDELDAWAEYRTRHGLRARRTELYFAQLARLAAGQGKVEDFLLREPSEDQPLPDEDAGRVDVQAVAADLGAMTAGGGARVLFVRIPKPYELNLPRGD